MFTKILLSFFRTLTWLLSSSMAFSGMLGRISRSISWVFLAERKLSCQDWIPPIERIEKKLQGWKGKLLLLGGHITPVNASLSATPLYLLSSRFCLWILHCIDCIRKRFPWLGPSRDRGYDLVKWVRFVIPKGKEVYGSLTLGTWIGMVLLDGGGDWPTSQMVVSQLLHYKYSACNGVWSGKPRNSTNV